MKLSFLSVFAVAASLAAAPLAASEVKPVQPKASTQAGTALLLGGLTTTQIAIVAVVAAAGFGAVANGGGSSNNTPTE